MSDRPVIDYQTPETARRPRPAVRRGVAVLGCYFFGVIAVMTWFNFMFNLSARGDFLIVRCVLANAATCAACYCGFLAGKYGDNPKR